MRPPRIILPVLIVTSALAGCRRDSSPAAAAARERDFEKTSIGVTEANLNARDVTVRVRKIGGPGGKQVLNQFTVRTPVGDDFQLTEQVGATQLELRGRVEDLGTGTF